MTFNDAGRLRAPASPPSTGPGRGRAIEVRELGGPDVLRPISVPARVPGPGQAVIDVAAADVIFLDTLIRSGRAAQWFEVTLPYVPGNGVSGRVAATGDGVDPALAGTRVIAHTGGHGGGGGYTSQAVVPAGDLVPVPDQVDLATAAAVMHDGVTAAAILAGTGIHPGESVLVLAAAGAMGLLLVQAAKAAGARVTGAARGRAKLDQVRAAGADRVVDYTSPGWAQMAVAAGGGRGPDLVLDGAGGELGRAAFGILADGGRFSAHGSGAGFAAIDPLAATRRGIRVQTIGDLQFGPAERLRRMATVLDEAAAGRVRPVIGQTYPLDRAADAHRGIEKRSAIGKTLLTVDGDLA